MRWGFCAQDVVAYPPGGDVEEWTVAPGTSTAQVIAAYQSGERTGAYWGIRSDITKYQLPDALDCPAERTLELAQTPTRLKRLPGPYQERLINWGYAVCDTAVRRHFAPGSTPNPQFPYLIGV